MVVAYSGFGIVVGGAERRTSFAERRWGLEVPQARGDSVPHVDQSQHLLYPVAVMPTT
jgi:hypothetical protein